MASGVPRRNGFAQPRDSLGGRVSVVFPVTDRLDELVDDGRRGGEIGVSHSEVDDILPASACGHLEFIDGAEDVWGKLGDPFEFHHGRRGLPSWQSEAKTGSNIWARLRNLFRSFPICQLLQILLPPAMDRASEIHFGSPRCRPLPRHFSPTRHTPRTERFEGENTEGQRERENSQTEGIRETLKERGSRSGARKIFGKKERDLSPSGRSGFPIWDLRISYKTVLLDRA